MNKPELLPAMLEPNQLGLVRPIATPAELLVLHDDVTAIVQKALKQGLDYDVIPGTGDKPSLLKPGAEKLNVAFGAAPEYDILEQQVDHNHDVKWSKRKKKWNNKFHGDKTFTWENEEGTSLGLYRYVVRCRLVREGRLLGTCIGVCSTMESKYVDRPRDCENTALKMAQKRAYVGATLHAYALSNRFTQDVEDNREQYAKAPPLNVTPVPEEPKAEEIKPVDLPYDGSTRHQHKLKAELKVRNVDESLWETIHGEMIGKKLEDLQRVLARVSMDPR